MSIGSLVSSGLSRASGSSTTGLKDFLSKFSANGGEYVRSIDPLNTFELTFRFHPNKTEIVSGAKRDDTWDKAKAVGANIGKDLINNATGGLFSNLMQGEDILKSRENFADGIHQRSFMEYLVKAHLLDFRDTTQLKLDLGLYCQDITIPQIAMPDIGSVTNSIGTFPINGTIVTPEQNRITMQILNTKAPLIDRLFYPWMREVVLPFWSYETQPYTTADVYVSFYKHADIEYVFYRCIPVYVSAIQANQQNTEVKRQVSMSFNYMCVRSKLNKMDTFGKKIAGTAGSLLGSAGTMMKI